MSAREASVGGGAAPAPPPARVLFLPDFRHGNPYQARLAEHLAEHGFAVELAAGDARRVLARNAFGRPTLDLVHLHWPENYVAARSRAKLAVRAALFLGLLAAVRRRGVPVVWTVHNLGFHEARHPALEEAVRRRLAALADGIAVHFPAGVETVRRRLAVPGSTPVAVTPLGGDPPAEAPRRRPRAPGEPYVFCLLGEIRAYKNVPRVVEAFRGLADPDLRLVVAGRVREPGIERELAALAAGDPRIELRFGFLDEAELLAILRRADAFVLGGDDYFTSASALQAAGWGLVVVAPPNPHLESFLAREGWLRYRAGDAADLAGALTAAAAGSASGEANRRRALELTYPRLAAATADLYRLVLSARGRPPRPAPAPAGAAPPSPPR